MVYTIKKEQEERGTILFIYYISSRYLSNRKRQHVCDAFGWGAESL